MEKDYRASFSGETINQHNILEELKQITLIPKKLKTCHKINKRASQLSLITNRRLKYRDIVDVTTARE
ncbi:MAG: hypothetical protein H6Q69_215 [Firmicutes bacterium]|nr:hypothetical protein [Bacillota bacterium]